MSLLRKTALLAVTVAFAGLAGAIHANAQSSADRDRMMRPLEDEKIVSTSPPELVVTRGWAHDKFARIVFDWRNPVKFKAKVVGENLKITFDRPLKSDFAKISRNLAPYFSDMNIYGNGRSVSARLKGYYTLRSFANENAVVIDLIPDNKPSSEVEIDPNAWLERTPKISVRAGKHPGFGRLVFDWQNDTAYEVEREGDVVRMRFDEPARIDVSRLSSALPGRVSAATSETTKQATRVGFIIPEAARVRHFRDGSKIALDIVVPEPPPGDENHAEGQATETPAQIAARKSKKAFAEHGKDKSPKAKSAGKPLSLKKKARRLRRIAERKRRLMAKKFKGAPLVTVEAIRRGSALDVKFNWRKKVSAAVFRRGQYFWVMFDDRARFSVDAIAVAGEGIVESAEQTEASPNSLIRIKAPEHLLATVTKAGNAWKMRLAPARMTGPVTSPVQVRSDQDSNRKAAILVTAKGITRPYVFVDPDVGDIVNVYGVPTPGVGNRVARRMIDLNIPATAAGLVLIPRRDDLALLRNSEGIYVTAPDGLSISSSIDLSASRVEDDSGYVFGPMAAWAGASPKEFEKNKHLHLRRILVAPRKQRNAARLNLVRFYVANGMAADAMGVIEVILRQDPKLVEDPKLRALRGASHFLLGHYVLAEADFSHQHLRNDPSIAPWRASIAAAKGDWQKAHSLVRDSRGIVSTFPKSLKVKFHLIGAEAALAVSDIDSAKPWIDALRSSRLKGGNAGYLKYLEGHAMRLAGKKTAARGVWRTILSSDDRRVRAKAKFALINADLESKQIDTKKAIEQLESLSFAWRGDAFEFDLNRRLGDIYAQQGDYRDSLLRLRQAASHFREVEGAGAIAQDMRDRFKQLFLQGGADKLEPVTALALYEEFRELTPAGREGDEMIRKLADRLTRVDLLSEAGRLLEHQVRFRLTGLERSRVGARLALIRMLNREPQKAIDALKLSVGEELPANLELQRRYLEARALGQQGKTGDALELLTGDVSHDAELLRLALFWNGQKWDEVAQSVRRLIPDRSVKSLTPKNADMVLRWAIALTMQNDMAGLRELRNRFGAAMAKTGYHEAFKAVAGADIGEVPNFKSLVRKTGDLKDFQSFLTSYRDKVQNNALSAIN